MDAAVDTSDVVVNYIETRIPVNVRQVNGWMSRAAIRDAVLAPRWLSWLEVFAGTGGISAALHRHVGARGRSIDVGLGGHQHNILEPEGFGLILQLCLALVVGGFSWWAPPCAAWIWLSQGVSKRTAESPSGDTDHWFVKTSNKIVDRMSLCLQLLALRKVFFICEQPLTSLLYKYASWVRMQMACPKILSVTFTRRFVWLGYFGGTLAKPTVLMGICPILNSITSSRPARRTKSVVKTTPKVVFLKSSGKFKRVFRVYGKKALLSRSQAYPNRFCEFIGLKVAETNAKVLALMHGGHI